jgi:hypothetical protein
MNTASCLPADVPDGAANVAFDFFVYTVAAIVGSFFEFFVFVSFIAVI